MHGTKRLLFCSVLNLRALPSFYFPLLIGTPITIRNSTFQCREDLRTDEVHSAAVSTLECRATGVTDARIFVYQARSKYICHALFRRAPHRPGSRTFIFYFTPNTSIVAIPTASTDAPFVFNEITQDFQQLSIQGNISYRVTDPAKVARYFQFHAAKRREGGMFQTIRPSCRCASSTSARCSRAPKFKSAR